MKPTFEIVYNKPKSGPTKYRISSFIDNDEDSFTAYKFKTCNNDSCGVRKFNKSRIIETKIL